MRIIFLLILTHITSLAFTQCPGALNCFNAYTFCDLEELNGFTCMTVNTPPSPIPGPPLCYGLGSENNIHWWSFVGDGNYLELTFKTDLNSCRNNLGIQVGVFVGSRCERDEIWDCNAGCGKDSITLKGPTERGATYFVWVDGCQGDLCEYEVSTNRTYESPKLPEPLPKFTDLDSIDGCGSFVMCAPKMDSLRPSYYWYWRDHSNLIHRKDSCARFTWPLHGPINGSSTEICLVMYLGNADHPDGICDIDTVCQEIPIRRVPVALGHCLEVCFEDQPYQWLGIPITSSCISPPCTARAENRDGSCIDSVKSIILLPEPEIGVKTIELCSEDPPYIAEDGRVFEGSVCDELITFSKRRFNPRCPAVKFCDTSYLLSISRYSFDPEISFVCGRCDDIVTMMTDIGHEEDCDKFDGVWETNATYYIGDSIITQRVDRDTFSFPYVDSFYIVVAKKSDTLGCFRLDTLVVNVPEQYKPQGAAVFGAERVKFDSPGQKKVESYRFEEDSTICDFSWFVNSNYGRIITPDPNSQLKVEVEWDGASAGQTAEICLTANYDCGPSTKCLQVELVRWTVSTSSLFNEPQLEYLSNGILSCPKINRPYTLEVFSINGSLVLSKAIEVETLLTPTLKPGWYIAVAKDENNEVWDTLSFLFL